MESPSVVVMLYFTAIMCGIFGIMWLIISDPKNK